jgi:hypothetical protein
LPGHLHGDGGDTTGVEGYVAAWYVAATTE